MMNLLKRIVLVLCLPVQVLETPHPRRFRPSEQQDPVLAEDALWGQEDQPGWLRDDEEDEFTEGYDLYGLRDDYSFDLEEDDDPGWFEEGIS